MLVLVVDDDQDIVTTQTRLLRMHNYEAISCTYARDVMALIEELRPEVVMLDLSMPDLTGYDIADELANNPDLKPQCLIAVTGHGQSSDREKTAAAGFDYHLLKPLGWNELETILERHRSEAANAIR